MTLAEVSSRPLRPQGNMSPSGSLWPLLGAFGPQVMHELEVDVKALRGPQRAP